MRTIEHTVNFTKVISAPKKKRARRAITALHRFSKKHFRIEEANVIVAPEVNEMIWSRGREKIPRRLELSFLEDNGKLMIFPKGQAEKEAEKLKKEHQKKKKEKPAKEAAHKETKDEKEEHEKQERLLENKREKEKAGEMAAIKRKTG